MKKFVKTIALLLVTLIIGNSIPVFADPIDDLLAGSGATFGGTTTIPKIEREEIENNQYEDLVLTDEEISELNSYLSELRASNNTNPDKDLDYSTLPDGYSLSPSILAGLCGTFSIPGIGQVVITVTGVIIIAGITISITSTIAKKVTDWIYSSKKKNAESAQSKIPSSVKKSNGNVDLDKFNQKVNGKTAWKDPKSGWSIEKDTSGHRGYDTSVKKWKIFDKSGNRIGSLNSDGKVIDK